MVRIVSLHLPLSVRSSMPSILRETDSDDRFFETLEERRKDIERKKKTSIPKNSVADVLNTGEQLL